MTLQQASSSQIAKEAAKRSLRRYAVMTANFRAGPDFAIIGAKRGGTTSLYNYLLEHPDVLPMFPSRQHIKGTHYFDVEHERGSAWYRSHFPVNIRERAVRHPFGRAVSGEGSPYYLFHPLAPQRMALEAPNTRLIVLLRDPVERAYSHYKERVRGGGELLTFEEALDAEDERLKGEAERIVAEPGYRSVEHEDHSYVAQGRYWEMLSVWFEHFPREQFLVVASEDFYRDPDRITNDVWAFLGIRSWTLRSRRRHNFHQAPDLPTAVRRRLEKALAPHNLELERMLGRTLPWPSSSSRTSGGSRSSLQTSVPSGEAPSTPADGISDGNEWPDVSVVIPTRNRPELLKRAVESVVSQYYPGRIECLVVFDQCEPEQLELDVPARHRVTSLANTRTPGLAGARNSGYLAAQGALLANCDDDDAWLPDKLYLQLLRLESSGADVVASGVRVHYRDKAVVRIPPERVEFRDLVRDRVMALHPSAVLFKRHLLADRRGLVDENLPGSYGEDYDWLLRAARGAPIVSVQRPLTDVYWHEKSYFTERWETIAKALSYLLAKYPEFRQDRSGMARIEGQIAFAQAAHGDRGAARKTLWRALRGNPCELRAYIALGVSLGILPSSAVVSMANRRGRGI